MPHPSRRRPAKIGDNGEILVKWIVWRARSSHTPDNAAYHSDAARVEDEAVVFHADRGWHRGIGISRVWRRDLRTLVCHGRLRGHAAKISQGPHPVLRGRVLHGIRRLRAVGTAPDQMHLLYQLVAFTAQNKQECLSLYLGD